MPRVILVIAATLIVTAAAAAQPPASAIATPATTARATPIGPSSGPRLLTGTKTNGAGTILGNALTSTNGALVNTLVRLRDARFGRIVGTQVTDNAGTFSFTPAPGSYIVEAMSHNRTTVLAASDIISVNAGDAVTAIVKLPYSTSLFATLFGNSAPTAAAVTAEAAASGVLAATIAGTPASDRPIR